MAPMHDPKYGELQMDLVEECDLPDGQFHVNNDQDLLEHSLQLKGSACSPKPWKNPVPKELIRTPVP